MVSRADCLTTLCAFYIGHSTTVEPLDKDNHLLWDKYLPSINKIRTLMPKKDEHLRTNCNIRSSEALNDLKLSGLKLLLS